MIKKDDLFLIRCDLIFSELDPNDFNLLKLLANFYFVNYPGELKPISELQKTHQLSEVNKKLLFKEGFYFGQYGNFRIQGGEHTGEEAGILLDQPVLIDYNEFNHRSFFLTFFSFRLAKENDYREEFLRFHLQNTFENNTPKFIRFLYAIMNDNQGKIILSSIVPELNSWINEQSRVIDLPNQKSSDDTGLGDSQKTKDINIVSEFIPKIAEAFSGLVDNEPDLLKLLNGDKLGRKVIFEGDAKKLVGAFKELTDAELIKNPREKVCSWIVENFQSKLKKKPKDLALDTVLNYLKGATNPSTKPVIAIQWRFRIT